MRRLPQCLELQSDAGLLSLLSSILESANSKCVRTTRPLWVCPDLSRVARVGSGRFKRNIHGLVPTVPTCPDLKTAESALALPHDEASIARHPETACHD